MANEGGSRNVFARLWAGVKRVFTLGLSEVKPPAEVPSNVEELRRLIISYEREGLELKDARLWLKKAEAEPDKAELYITYGFYEANRQRQKRNHRSFALGFFIGAIVLFIIYIFLWYVLQEKEAYIKSALFVPIILFIISLINILRFLILNKKPRLRITDIPKTTGELCPVIVEYEGRGVNVEEAWDLYRKAEEIEIRAKTEEKPPLESAGSLLQRAYADLLIKSGQRWPSVLAVWFSAVVLVATVFSFIAMLLWEEDLPIEEVIIGIPIFVIIWGLVGSASFSLVQANRLIRERLMNWYDLVRYFCRIIAGGILAAVVFYIVQLGAVSLPGNVSKEITAALERAEAAEKYAEAVRWTTYYEDQEKEKDEIVWRELESSESLGLKEQYDIVMGFRNEWYSLKPTADAEDPSGRAVIVDVSPETLENAFAYYKTVKATRDDGFGRKLENVFLPRIEKRMENRKPEFTAIKETVDQKDNVREKLLVLLMNADKWSPVYTYEGEEVLNGDIVANTIEDYDTPSPEYARTKKNFENELEAVKTDLKSAIRGRQSKYRDEQKKVRRWKCYFRSEAIKEEVEDLKKKGEELLKARGILMEEKRRIEAEDPDSPESKARLEEIDKTIAGNVTSYKDNGSSLSEKKIELDNAYLAENARPIWESPLFIVLAFLSGYSVEFASRLIDKIAKSYNNAEEKSPPEPGPQTGSGTGTGDVVKPAT